MLETLFGNAVSNGCGGERGGGRKNKLNKTLSAPLSTPAENKFKCYYQHRLRDLVSPASGVFNQGTVDPLLLLSVSWAQSSQGCSIKSVVNNNDHQRMMEVPIFMII